MRKGECHVCGGSGVVDSGGFNPDGTPIDVACTECVPCRPDNRFIDLHHCAVSGEIPQEIEQLIDRCAIRDLSIDNEDLSLALKFCEMLWNRLVKMAEHYESMAELFPEGDIRGPMQLEAARDMRFVLSDCARDL